MNELITNKLLVQNPWWMDASARSVAVGKKRRRLFPDFKERTTNRNLITGLIGLRRVGKSTLIYQMIDDLLNSGHNPESILYFLFEEEPVKNNLGEMLRKVIEYQISKKINQKSYIFLDEIQFVDNWNSILKYYFDTYPNLKFVVSGSSSLFIHTKATESLSGRMQILTLYPMGYGEYLHLNNKDNLPENFRKYLSWGEFPYLENLPHWMEKKEYLNDFIINKILENDLPKLKKIYGSDINIMANVLIDRSGQTIEIQNLARDLNIAQNTARSYLSILEKTGLISQIYNLGIGFRNRSVRQRKVYSSSVNSIVLRNIKDITSESWQNNIGNIIETFVYNHLIRKYSSEVYFWRKRQIKEVDFVINKPEEKLPIEVKYQNTINPKDLSNLIYFCKKEKINEAMLVTKNDSATRKIENIRINMIPAHKLTD